MPSLKSLFEPECGAPSALVTLSNNYGRANSAGNEIQRSIPGVSGMDLVCGIKSCEGWTKLFFSDGQRIPVEIVRASRDAFHIQYERTSPESSGPSRRNGARPVGANLAPSSKWKVTFFHLCVIFRIFWKTLTFWTFYGFFRFYVILECF